MTLAVRQLKEALEKLPDDAELAIAISEMFEDEEYLRKYEIKYPVISLDYENTYLLGIYLLNE